MPNATVRANAQTLPIDRDSLFRAILPALAADTSADPEVVDAVAHVRNLLTIEEAAHQDLNNAEAHGRDPDAAQRAYDRAVTATAAAGRELLALRPRTLAGLRALAAALVLSDVLDTPESGAALARLVVEAPIAADPDTAAG